MFQVDYGQCNVYIQGAPEIADTLGSIWEIRLFRYFEIHQISGIP